MTTTGADQTRKACTFILAEIMALGTFSALSVLTVNIVAGTSVCRSLSDANYSALIVYLIFQLICWGGGNMIGT